MRAYSLAAVLALGLVPAAWAQETPPDSWRPVQLAGEAPLYPVSALSRGLEGECEVRFHIDQSGAGVDFQVSCSDPVFERSALAAAQSWRFTPYPGPEELSVVRYLKPVNFRLAD